MPGTPTLADDLLQGLAPVAGPDARVLILGSMPGVRSLDEARYYAHPRNAFWTILGAWTGVAPEAAYAERIDALRAHGIALWDVIGRCRRSGSLDSRIDPASIEANDLAGLLLACPRIERVLLNGGRAAQDYQRRVLPTLDAAARALPRFRLPSTSPAHASVSLAAKRSAWDEALRPVLGAG
ncbi:DNA-deoxyinosine glycosylase [Wenzhouxiangella sp. XN79A]|uniref:DNA-deoxyinosine glycosylase n=1 Tax=Wenzhouxiangella sp. XN79A TaxID=2724193 RepID=UPI00144A530F|nr:DNA-deoxyinosine glycosylase [Wenzhouxiangella sp. XN79A]NKI35023.1 DNA-deoxyinosine glycosylase [Wenzhouxiangella sp. XN79A]